MSTIERIFELMENNKVSAYKLSKEVGVSQGNISDWKSGKANPSYGAVVKIANYFSVSPEYIEGKTDIPLPAFAEFPGGIIKQIDKSDPQITKLLEEIKDMTPEELNILESLAKTMKANRKK